MPSEQANQWKINTSTSASTVIWKAWTTASTTVATTTDIWGSWVLSSNSTTATSTSDAVVLSTWAAWNQSYRISNEEFQRRLARNEQATQQRLQVEGEKKAARERAAQLLQEHLTAEQKAELADKGFFSLRTLDRTGRPRHYQIRRGTVRNVHEVDPVDGRRIRTLCAHPRVAVPDEDTMLIQKLMLESPEGHEEFLRVANISYH